MVGGSAIVAINNARRAAEGSTVTGETLVKFFILIAALGACVFALYQFGYVTRAQVWVSRAVATARLRAALAYDRVRAAVVEALSKL